MTNTPTPAGDDLVERLRAFRPEATLMHSAAAEITRLRSLLEVTDENVERVARAIHEDRNEWRKPQDRVPWEQASHAQRVVAISTARAALVSLASAEKGCGNERP